MEIAIVMVVSVWVTTYGMWKREVRKFKACLEYERAKYQSLLEELQERRAEQAPMGEEIVSLRAERDGLQHRNDIQAGQLRHIDSEISPLMSQVSSLKAELAHRPTTDEYMQLMAERDELADRAAELASLHPGETVEGVISERDSCRIQLSHAQQDISAFRAELAQRQSVPVKVRFDVTAQQLCERLNKIDVFVYVETIHKIMDYLAQHAVIDAPAGVPSVEDLAYLQWRAENDKGIAEGRDWEDCEYDDEARGFSEVGTTAIRNAILASLQFRPMPAGVPDPDVLARVAYREIKASKLFLADGWDQWQFEELIPEFKTELRCLGIAVWNEGRVQFCSMPTREDVARVLCETYGGREWEIDKLERAAKERLYAEADAVLALFAGVEVKPDDTESLKNALIEAKRQRDEAQSKLIAIENPIKIAADQVHKETVEFLKRLQMAQEATWSHNSGPYGEPVSDTYNSESSGNSGELPADADVEALARVLMNCNAQRMPNWWENCPEGVREQYREEARAAFAWFDKRGDK